MTHNPRIESDLPQCVDQWGWTYHHMGIPSAKKLPNMRHIPHLGMWVLGFETSPYGVEWMYFDEDSIIDSLIQKIPHPAFVVPNLRAAIKDKQLIGAPSIPSKGIKVAMILHNGAPVELMQFDE